MAPLLTSVVLALAASTSAQLAAVSWGKDRGDVFGFFHERIFHKFWTGHDWQPDGVEYVSGASSMVAPYIGPTALGYDGKRLDLFYVGEAEAVFHRYYDGHGWRPDDLPDGPGENLGAPPEGGANGAVAAAVLEGALNLVVLGTNGSVFQKYWSEKDGDWQPGGAGGEWESLGGDITGSPAVAAVGRQLHVFGVHADEKMLLHRYWDSTQWVPADGQWETLGGGPFQGSVAATSWADDRFDAWAVGEDGSLQHRYWQTDHYSDWEVLGDAKYYFVGTPQVVSQRPGSFDIVAATEDKHGRGYNYLYKAFDGHHWYPDATGFYEIGGPFVGQPGIVSWSDHSVALFGVSSVDARLKFRVWNGPDAGWYPNDGSWADLGALDAPDQDGMGGLRGQEL